MKRYKKENLNVLSVNIFVLVLSICFLIFGFITQSKSFFNGTFVNEVFIIFLPALFLCGTGNRKKVLRIRPISFKNFIRVIIVVIVAYPIILLLNGLLLNFLSNFIELKNFSMNVLLKDESIGRYLFFMCLVPAICEEIFFRGALINSYDIYGGRFAILMSSLVFALFHFDIQNFIAPLLLGIIFGNLLELTGSIFAPILAHFVNNVIGIILTKYGSESIFNFLRQMSIAQDIGSLQVYVIIVLLAVSMFSAIFLRFMFKRMNREKIMKEKELGIRKRTRSIQTIDFFNFVPIIAFIVLYFIYYTLNF